MEPTRGFFSRTTFNVSYKVVVVGEISSGKTGIVLRYTMNQFYENCKASIGLSLLSKSEAIEGHNMNVTFDIWDTAGQERFNSLAAIYYRNADVVLVVYDITRTSSLDRAIDWVRELKENSEKNVIIALVGNKRDLEHKRVVSCKEGKDHASNLGVVFAETSAKSGENIDKMFKNIAKTLAKTFEENGSKKETAQIQLTTNKSDKTKTDCCK